MVITRTPFRISFFGGGTDLPDWYRGNGGGVLSTTIDKYLYITLRKMPPFWEFRNRFVYGSRSEILDDIDDIEHPSIRETLRFKHMTAGVDMHYNTDIPARSGIGSSSSFTVGFLKGLYSLEGKMVSPERLASEAIHIEQNLIREAVGSQDQIAAAYGGLNHIVFKTDGAFEISPMTLPVQRVKELNDHLVLVFTGLQRSAAEIEAEKIKQIGRHTGELKEIARYVDEAIEILNTGTDIAEFGALLHETWMKKKQLSEQVSNEEMDQTYGIAREAGAIGGKLLGAGGGGFFLFFVRPEDRAGLIRRLSFLTQVPFKFEATGSQVIYYQGEDYNGG
ncbi:MAG: kinase [Peptococcaceae bacterium]|jgi:D-glycero-alpha-D-manno-heptose-7-phosphate kinase|nr:kinase [Peptococcaceae bacterium]